MATNKGVLNNIQVMCESMMKKQSEQDESIKRILEKQNEHDDFIKNHFKSNVQKNDNERKRKLGTDEIEIPAKNANLESPATEVQEKLVPVLTKSFVLKHVFNRVSYTPKTDHHIDYAGYGIFSDDEEHFGLYWYLCIENHGGNVRFLLYSHKSQSAVYFIETMCTLKFIHPNGKVFTKSGSYSFNQIGYNGLGEYKFMKWKEMMKDYVVDDKLTVEAHVTILKMSGIYKDNLRRFDESMEKVSDVILIVQDEKFHVSKLYLATHSPYFEALFLGRFDESQQSEITLTGIDSNDFQKYLEVLYGEAAIDDLTVEGLLLVAEMYDTNIVIRKCAEFLLKKTRKNAKTKFRIAFRYKLNELKKKCMSGIKTIYEIRSMMPADINDLDPSVTTAFLERCLALSR